MPYGNFWIVQNFAEMSPDQRCSYRLCPAFRLLLHGKAGEGGPGIVYYIVDIEGTGKVVINY